MTHLHFENVCDETFSFFSRWNCIHVIIFLTLKSIVSFKRGVEINNPASELWAVMKSVFFFHLCIIFPRFRNLTFETTVESACAFGAKRTLQVAPWRRQHMDRVRVFRPPTYRWNECINPAGPRLTAPQNLQGKVGARLWASRSECTQPV